MSFSAEINDFVNGFKAGASVGGDIQDRKMAKEKWEFEKAFKQGAAGRANRALDIREKGIGARAADKASKASAKAADKADKAAAKEAEKAHKSEIKDFNELTRPGSGGGGGSSGSTSLPDEYSFNQEFPEGDPAADELGNDESVVSADEAIPVESDRVRYAAGGGMMEADSKEQEVAAGKADSEVAETAIPEEIPVKGDAETAPADPKPAEGKSDPIFKETANVTKAVMDQWNSEVGQKEEAVATKPQKTQDRIADVKPASPEEMKALWAKVDPTGEMNGQMKGAQTLVKAYKFFMEKGDAVKAKKIAGQIIKFNQMASMTQGQLALQALRQGDLASASRLVSDAATENVPDGTTVTAEPTPNGTVLYKIDRAGYAQQQGEMGAKQLWELASGVANGSLYIKRMAALAGEADPTSESNEGAIPAASGKRSYSKDVAAAATARKQFDALQKKYDSEVGLNGEGSKDALALKGELDAAYTGFNKAWKQAQIGAKKTGHSEKVLGADFRNALGMTVLPPPDYKEPGAEDPPQGDAKGDAQGDTEQAINPNGGPQLTTPPPVMKEKVIGDKTYQLIGGQWYEKGAE